MGWGREGKETLGVSFLEGTGSLNPSCKNQWTWVTDILNSIANKLG
jgi:hypothetical protein